MTLADPITRSPRKLSYRQIQLYRKEPEKLIRNFNEPLQEVSGGLFRPEAAHG